MEEKKQPETRASFILFLVFILAAVLSVAVPGRRFADPDSYSGSVQALNETKVGVEKLAGSAAARGGRGVAGPRARTRWPGGADMPCSAEAPCLSRNSWYRSRGSSRLTF